MPLTVLFDLDDTLLSTNMAEFLPAYFHALGESLSSLASTEVLTDQIHHAVQVMGRNTNPCLMLNEIFADQFYLPLGATEKEFRPLIDRFYSVSFPKLKQITQPRPEAQELIEWCKSQGMRMAIATNPLFPETATRQRIMWAGLDPSDFVFFSTFNDFHFTKPNLTYYAECLGRLGWPQGNIVMVGDNPKHDLQPMEALGFPTFEVNSTPISREQPSGRISEVQSWIQQQQSVEQTGILDTFEVNLAILRSTSAVIDSWVKILPDEIFSYIPAKDEWSVNEIIWHLADMESEVYLPQWQQLSDDIRSHISWPDTSRWAEQRGYRNRPIGSGLEIFCKSRKSTLELIENLDAKGLLDEPIQHTTFSQTTPRELISFCARHDRIHLHQAFEIIDIYKFY